MVRMMPCLTVLQNHGTQWVQPRVRTSSTGTLTVLFVDVATSAMPENVQAVCDICSAVRIVENCASECRAKNERGN